MMSKKIVGVVGTMFFRDGKLLIDKPRERPTFQMVGGRIEKGETPLETAIRENKEELGNQFIYDESKLRFIMDFKEVATSDPKLDIHMYVFQYDGELGGKTTTSEEIEAFMWFGINDDQTLLSNTLKNKILPYAIKNKLIY